MAKRYISTMRPDQPELQWREGKLFRLDLNVETDMDELAALGYYTATEDGAKCWCGGKVGPRNPGDDEGLGCLDSLYHDWSSNGRPKEITKLYIAGPMSGYPGNNYDAFNQAAEVLRHVGGFEVVNPAEFGADGGHYVDLIRKDLELMLPCHGVALLEHWWESVGARNEVNVAGMLKMPVRTVGEWVGRRLFDDNTIRNATF
jgi:hypothetical protein